MCLLCSFTSDVPNSITIDLLGKESPGVTKSLSPEWSECSVHLLMNAIYNLAFLVPPGTYHYCVDERVARNLYI